MSPSRPFILRPVATTLLMVAILLSGIIAYRFLPLAALPEVDYPTIQVADLLSRREPRRDDLVGDGAARGPARPDAGAQPDELGKLGRLFGDHAAVQPQAQPRRRRAGGPGRDQRRRQPVAVRSAGAADLRQGQPGRRADPHARAQVGFAAAAAGRGPRRHAAGDEDFAVARRRARQHQRRPAAGGAHPGRSSQARGLWAQHRRPAHHARQRQRQHAEGQFRRPDARVDHQCQRPADERGRLPQSHHRLPQRLAGAPERRRQRGRRGAERQARGMDEPVARGHSQRPAPARRQRHRGGRQHQGAAAAAAGRRSPPRSTCPCSATAR